MDSWFINIVVNNTELIGYRDNGILTDITFVVGLRSFKAHKIVLISCGSNYFKQLILGSFKEASQSKIDITQTDPIIFGLMLDMIYGKKINDQLDVTIALELLRTLDAYEFVLSPELIESNLGKMNPTKDEVVDYILTTKQFLQKISPKIMSKIRSVINGYVDLSPLDDDTIRKIFDSEGWDHNGDRFFLDMINDLVKSGRSPELYRLILFQDLDDNDLDAVPLEYIHKYTEPSDFTLSSLIRDKETLYNTLEFTHSTDKYILPVWVTIAYVSQDLSFVRRFNGIPDDTKIGLLQGCLNDSGEYILFLFKDVSGMTLNHISDIELIKYDPIISNGILIGVDILEYRFVPNRLHNYGLMKNFLYDDDRPYQGLSDIEQQLDILKNGSMDDVVMIVAMEGLSANGYILAGRNIGKQSSADFETGAIPINDTIIVIFDMELIEDNIIRVNYWEYF